MRRWFNRTVLGAILASSLVSTVPAFAAMDMFIKLGSIKGESVDSKHKDEIDVLSWSWGVSQSVTPSSTKTVGAASGRANVNALVITKYIDSSSPMLFQSAVQGSRITDALFVVRKTGGKAPLDFIKIKLKDAIITSVKPGGSAGQDRFTEEITIVFTSVEYSYVPQKLDGSSGTAVTATWAVAG